MNLIKNTLKAATVLLVASFMFAGTVQAMTSPEQVVKSTVDTMVAKLQNNRTEYEANTQALFNMLNETLIPALHIPRMTDLILGKEVARKASPAQKKAFSEEFKTLLLNTYGTTLLSATGKEKVVYQPVDLKPGADKVKVKATLISASGSEFLVTLFMSNRKDTRWRAYNIEAAGINFIRTYRSTYAATLKQKGIDGLIADLRSKNAQ